MLRMTRKTRNSIERYLKTTELFNNKDNLQNSGVYQLTSNECGATYMGQTGRTFEKKKGLKETFFNLGIIITILRFHNIF